MSKQVDYDALAHSFLDLWQDQATRMARDPEMRTFAEQWMALFMPFAQTPAEPDGAAGREHDGFSPDYRAGGASRAHGAGRAAAAGPGEIGETRGVDEGPEARESGASAETGAAPVAAVPDDRDAELERLAARVRELEERLASLESRPRDTAAGSGTPTERQRRGDSRKRRS
ncbi:hypothetical protein [Nisaea nitritireducens]|uniref:hypothetical protein n=1 Tax=Nisaea nitritireducens TaxID=568392 RepID=UPI001D0021EA|nr:hypothetical protein [Nisaea nitritireducens]